MSTSFTKVFDRFLNINNEYNSIMTYPDNLAYQMLSSWLMSGIGEVEHNFKEYSDVSQEFEQEVYNFTFDGDSFNTILTDYPTEDGIVIYLDINGEEHSDFSFNANTGELIVFNAPSQNGNKLYVGVYVQGKFSNKLKNKQINILVDWLEMQYTRDKINSEVLNIQTVQGKDYSYSGTQANHIRSLQSKLEYMKSKFYENLEGRYSYQYDKDDLDRLGG